MRKKKDLSGMKFGKLRAMFRLGKIKTGNADYWGCICECGNMKNVTTSNLLNGNTKSCGCLRRKNC